MGSEALVDVRFTHIGNDPHFPQDVLRTLQSAVRSYRLERNDTDTLNVVATELAENIIKYSNWKAGERPTLEVRLQNDDSAVVTTTNPVDTAGPHYASLKTILARIQASRSPGDVYRERVLEVSENPRSWALSGLGIARIAADECCRIEAALEGAAMLRVTTVIRLGVSE